jgi:ATP-dependent Clp protease ATP-binding subunit ClpC
MSEFMEHHNAARLVGAPPGYVGYDQAGQLTEAVKRRPYSVVLFDEVEKAHPKVFDMLLQVLEDGRLADAKGREVDFNNTIVIMTSNVGAELFGKRGDFGFTQGNRPTEEAERADHERLRALLDPKLKELFRPEFLNRVDDVVYFSALGRAEVRAILELMLAQTQARLSEQFVDLRVTDAAKEYLAMVGYDREFGARPLRRTVQRLVEDRLAEGLLRRLVKAGKTVTIDRSEREGLVFKSGAAVLAMPDSRPELEGPHFA